MARWTTTILPAAISRACELEIHFALDHHGSAMYPSYIAVPPFIVIILSTCVGESPGS